MHRILVSTAALLVLANAVVAQKIETVKIRLNHMQASEFAHTLKTTTTTRSVGGGQPDVQEPLLPPGIRNIIAYNEENSLLVTGTAEAVTQFREIVRLLDVPQRQVSIKTRLLRTVFTEKGRQQEELLQAPVITTVNNRIGQVSLTDRDKQSGMIRNGYRIEVQPRINGDDSVSLFVKWNLWITLDQKNAEGTDAQRQITREATMTRPVLAGQTLRFALRYVPNSGKEDAQQPMTPLHGPALDNFKPEEPGKLFILEMTPVLVKDAQNGAATP